MPAKRQRFAARRKAVGFSQEQLAERLDIDRSTVARWESGETEPQPWIRPRLARVLQVSLNQLDHLLAGGGLTEAEAAERMSHALTHPGSADIVTVAHLRNQVHHLDEQYVHVPSSSLLAQTGQCLGQVRFLAAHAVSKRVRRELYAVEAEAAILMGQLVWDASQRRDHASARLYLDQAIDAARQVRDPAAEGLALLRKAMIALYGERDPREGLALAKQTTETTSQVSDVLTGLAILHTAEAHAMLGELASCEAALAAADTRFGRVGEPDTAIELYSVTQFGRMAVVLPLPGGHQTGAGAARNDCRGSQRSLEIAGHRAGQPGTRAYPPRRLGRSGRTAPRGHRCHRAEPRRRRIEHRLQRRARDASLADRARRPGCLRPAAHPHGRLSDHGGMTATNPAKQAVRERVWSQLERAGVVEPRVSGYIPAFEGADQAAERLADLPVWQQAQILEVVPDRAQLPVRIRALQDGKLVYMAVPKLAAAEPFYLLDPQNLPVPASEAADRTVAARIALGVSIGQMRVIDLIVCGSVAVNERGVRLGKGAGYSDIEMALLAEAGLLSERTIIATTVHELQVRMRTYPSRRMISTSI